MWFWYAMTNYKVTDIGFVYVLLFFGRVVLSKFLDRRCIVQVHFIGHWNLHNICEDIQEAAVFVWINSIKW